LSLQRSKRAADADDADAAAVARAHTRTVAAAPITVMDGRHD
jgi:hypothetical protein